MVHRMLLAGLALGALLLYCAAPAYAGEDRLGGAYRGPYDDKYQPKEDTQEDSTESQDDSSTGLSSGSGSGDNSGSTDDSGGATAPPPDEGGGGGDETGDGDGGATAPPPEDPGGGGEPGSTPPEDVGNDPGGPAGSLPPGGGSSPDTGGGSGASVPSGAPGGGKVGRGGKATEDVFAYWPFWFEHNKEWILAEILNARGSKARVPQKSSVWYFTGAGGEERSPVTDEQKMAKVYPLLVESLKDPVNVVRDAAVLALGKLGRPEVVPHLLERLNDPQEKMDIKEDVLLALGLTGQKEALSPLMNKLNDRQLGSWAALGLALLGDKVAVQPILTEYSRLVKQHQTERAAVLAIALGSLGTEDIVDELAVPIKARKGNELKVYVCQALGRIGGEKSQKWLLRALQARNKDVQAAAVLALSNYPDKSVVGYLIGKRGLGSSDKMSKLFAAVALGKIGREMDTDAKILQGIRKDLRKVAESVQKDKYAAMYASLGLGIMGDTGAEDIFEEYLESDNAGKFQMENHTAMAMACGLLEDERVVRDLRAIANRASYEPDYRGYACFALGIMGDRKSKENIRSLVEKNGKKEDLVRSGCWALGLIGDRNDLDVLVKMLKEEENRGHDARGAAAIAIGLIGDQAAVDKLIEMIKNDPNNVNRAFAIAALGCLVDTVSVPRVAQLFQNLHYRQYRNELPVVKEALQNL